MKIVFQSLIIAALVNIVVTAQDGCLVGDIMFQNGADLGFLGLECLNSTHFDASESACVNGVIEETATVLSCSGSVPYCVQCGNRTAGAALCLSTPEVPPTCDDILYKPVEAVPTATAASDKMIGSKGMMKMGGMGMIRERILYDVATPKVKRFRGSNV